jgi:predicted aconitase with swiveling domain
MSRTFKGRVVIGGNVTGESVVTHQGFNVLASYLKALGERSNTAICSDQNNKDIFGKDLAGKIICLPQTIGSTTGGMILQSVANLGIGPKAMLFSEHIDSLAAAGIILCEVWNQKTIVTIDQLGSEFLDYVKTGQQIEVKEDGTVIVM